MNTQYPDVERLFMGEPAQSALLYPGMKISDISVDISPIYPILVMFDTISAMTDISVLDRYIVEISGLWHTRGLV